MHTECRHITSQHMTTCPQPAAASASACWCTVAHPHAATHRPLACPQALTTSVAVWYGLETFRLRSKEEEIADQAAAGMLPPPQGQQGYGVPPYQQPMGMGYPGDPMAAPGTSGYMNMAPPGAVPMAGAFLPPAREQAYPWGVPQPATIVQPGPEAEAAAAAGGPDAYGRWGAPPQQAQLPGPSGTGLDPYAQPAYDPAMAMYAQQAPMQADGAAPGYYTQQPGPPGDPYYGMQPPQQQQGAWQQPQQPYMPGPADPQQQWYGAPDAQPSAAAAPAGYGDQGYGMAAAAGYPGPAAATAAPQQQQQQPVPPKRPVSNEPIDDWE
jgi:hypothetical protein